MAVHRCGGKKFSQSDYFFNISCYTQSVTSQNLPCRRYGLYSNESSVRSGIYIDHSISATDNEVEYLSARLPGR